MTENPCPEFEEELPTTEELVCQSPQDDDGAPVGKVDEIEPYAEATEVSPEDWSQNQEDE